MIIDLDDVQGYDTLKKLLEEGHIIAFPTETVYGVCAKFDSKEGFDKILSLKHRDANKPCQVLTYSTIFFKEYTNINPDQLRVANRFMPGELTLIVPAKKDKLPSYLINENGGVGVRIPKYKKLLELLEYLDFPLLATSLNVSGETPLFSAIDVIKQYKSKVSAIIVDDNLEVSNIPSTVCDVTDGIKVYREGNLKKEDIKSVMNRNKVYKTIYIGNDTGGYELKKLVQSHLEEEGYNVCNLGCDTTESTDYPIYAIKVAESVSSDSESKGIVICKSGEGVSIAANKVKGIRAGICYNNEVAEKIVQHNNCNVAAFGASYFTPEEVFKMVDIYLSSDFEGGRHQRRVAMLDDYQQK